MLKRHYIPALLAIWLVFECTMSWFATCQQVNYGQAHDRSHQNNCTVTIGPVVSLTRFVAKVGAAFLKQREHELVAGFTIVLAISTIFLWLSTRDAARAGARAAVIAEKSLTELERAFVTHTFTFGSCGHPGVEYWELRMGWKNIGRTQTRGLYTRCSWDHFPGDIPADFTFPDLFDGDPDIAMSFIAAGDEIVDEPMQFEPYILEAARQGHIRIFTWGWAEYDDIFPGTKPHRSEFCNEIIPLADPYRHWPAGVQTARFRIVGRHVGADDECYRHARPRELRHIPLT